MIEKEERIDIYTIPPNFAEEGTLLSGRIKTRNAVETAAVLLVLVPVLMSLEMTGKAKIYIGVIILVPTVILSVLGIQGESLFVFIGSFFQYVRRRRYLAPPDAGYRLERNRKKEKLGKRGKCVYGRKGRRESGTETRD